MRNVLTLLACVFLAGPALAQDRPFVFSVVPSPADGRSWTAYYDAGYGERTAEPLGYAGVLQNVGFQGRLAKRLTLLGNVGLGFGADGTRASQEAELLGDVIGSTSGLRVALGLGARREWEGTTAALGRVCLGWSGRRTLFFGNLRLERALARDRDPVDLVTSLGWLQSAGPGLRLGLEAVGQDLEGFWQPDEAEGGAKLYAGPAVHWSPPAGRFWLSASGGPIVYGARSGRTSSAARPLDAVASGFTVRLSFGYSF